MPKNHDFSSQTVGRALGILGCFSVDAPEWHLKDLSAQTGLTVPTTHRIAKTLVAGGFLRQSPSTKRFSVGPAVMKLAGAFTRRDDLLETVRSRMVEVRDASGETVALHWLVNRERIRVASVESDQPVRIASPVGQTNPLYLGAAGKVLLASMPEEDRLAYVTEEVQAGHLATSVDQFMSELEGYAQAGYAMSFGDLVVGVSSLAVPIRDPRGNPVAALSVGGPLDRWTPERMVDVIPVLKSVAAEAETALP